MSTTEGEGSQQEESSRPRVAAAAAPSEAADPAAGGGDQVLVQAPPPSGGSNDDGDETATSGHTPVTSNVKELVDIDKSAKTGIGDPPAKQGDQSSSPSSPSSILPKATDSTTDDYESSTTGTGDSHQTSISSRQVIAVSASKGPAAFFNLARKFLITDDVVDLSALEGAIVSAVDAAHLLERSKLASIVRIHTSYVAVDPKRKRQESMSEEPSPPLDPQALPSYPQGGAAAAHAVSSSSVQQDTVIYTSPPRTNDEASAAASPIPASSSDPKAQQRRRKEHYHRTKGSPLKRARIIITVQRSPEYKQWLDENPKQAIIAAAGGGDDDIPPPTTGVPSGD